MFKSTINGNLRYAHCCRIFFPSKLLTVGKIIVLLFWQTVDCEHAKYLWCLKRSANSFKKVMLPASVCLRDSSSRQEMIPGEKKKIIMLDYSTEGRCSNRNNCLYGPWYLCVFLRSCHIWRRCQSIRLESI